MPQLHHAVTTRSRLRSARFFPDMFRASEAVKRQLVHTPGCLRFASVIGGPREFWSISVWRDRHSMQEFMREDAHESFMWNFSRWFDSFWLMRWMPTDEELGTWEGRRLGASPAGEAPDGLGCMEQVLQDIPELLVASRGRGAPSLDDAPPTRRARRRVRGVTGFTVRIEVPLRDVPAALREARRLSELCQSGEPLRLTTGLEGPHAVWALVVGRDLGGVGESVAALADRWPVWALRWEAIGEFGQWDGLRLRRSRPVRDS